MKSKHDGNRPDARRLAAAGHVAASVLALSLCVLAAAGPAQAEPPSPEEVVAVLQELRTELEWPGLAVEQAAKNLKTPQEAFRFVRDEILLVNYRGSYAGPEAALRTRVANATDKSALLAALLERMGVKARLARSNWPKGARPHQGPGPRRALPALKKLTRLLGPEGGEAGPPPEPLSDEQLRELQDEISASARLIENLLTAAGRADLLKGVPDPKDTEPTRTDIDWVWVQAQLDGKTWTDMDPVFPKQPRPGAYFKPFAPKPVTVIIRLEAGRSGQEKADALLQWSGPCGNVLGRDILLSYFPADKNIKAAEEPEKVEHWKPFLSCGQLQVLGKAFTPSGGPAKAAVAAPKPPARPAGGFGGLLGPAKRPPPKPPETRCDFLRLLIELNDPGGLRPWSASFSRIVQHVGSGYDAHGLIATHRIGLGTAFVPVRVVESRMADEVINAHRLRQMAQKGDAVKVDGSRGYSTRTARVLNTLFFLQMAVTPPQLKLGWKGPAVVVETHQLRNVKGELFFASRLDALHQPFGPQADQSRRQRVLWGLATCAVEARLLKTESVNQHLLAAGKGLRVIAKADARLRSHVDAEAIQKSVLAEGGLVLASKDAPTSVWAIRPTGDLLGLYSDSHSGAAAKGAGTRARSRSAGRAYAAVGSGAMATLGCPAGVLVGPLAQYFSELAKAYEGAAGVLEDLANTIETGDMRYMNKNRAGYFQNLGGHLTNAMTQGFVRSWAESAAGAGITRFLPTGPAGSPKSRIIDGIVATDLSLPEEFPVFPRAMRRAMEAVAVPTP